MTEKGIKCASRSRQGSGMGDELEEEIEEDIQFGEGTGGGPGGMLTTQGSRMNSKKEGTMIADEVEDEDDELSMSDDGDFSYSQS
jgi:hypothetical protein